MFGLLFVATVVYLYDAFDVVSLVNENVIYDINVGILYFDSNILKSLNSLSTLLGVKKDDINKDVNIIFNDNPEFLSFYNDDDLNKTLILFNGEWIEVKKNIIVEGKDNLGKVFTLNNVSSRVSELEQKDMLVKEVNHRVKNNLQIILSLLNLDIRFHPDEPEIVIDDTRSRINYMFTLHDKIYRSNSSTDTNIKDYLPDIAKSLLQMYDMNVKVWEDLDEAMINLDLAIPLGLMLTEVINNLVKYAYPGSDNGNFFIKFKFKGSMGVLDLYDDGVGLPDSFDFESSTGLGMTVIKSLTSQIDADTFIIPDEGAHFRIIFPL
jgi:two-component sensor histidine kinase